MLDFDHGEDARLLQETVRSFADKELRPRLREVEKAGAVSPSGEKAWFGLGASVLSLPEDVGGAAMGESLEVLVGEELGAGDLGTAMALPGPGAFGLCVQLLGTPAQHALYLKEFANDPHLRGAVAYSEKPQAGVFTEGMSTRATRAGDGFVLDGVKHPVMFGRGARFFVVFAQVEGAPAGMDGLGAFVVDAKAAGVTAGEKLGSLALDACGLAPVTFHGVKVEPQARLGGNGDFKTALMQVLARAGVRGASRVVGASRAAYQMAVSYAETRTTFGKPIGHHQGLAFLLADMATAVDSMRWLVWHAAWALDQKHPDALTAAARAVAEAAETGMWVCNQVVQVHGGAGFIQDLPLEKWMREAKAIMNHALSPQLADVWGAAGLLGKTLSSEDALPSATVQPVLL